MSTQAERLAKLPRWIWHPERNRRLKCTLKRSFVVLNEIEQAELRLAATGKLTVFLDGQKVGEWPEHPRHIAAFEKLEGFPTRLAPGQHELVLQLECEQPVPVGPISIHLQQRLVGCIGFIQGSGFWLPTNGKWATEDGLAAEVCLYGEEPYGDLENSPDWFIIGGFGDIETEPVEHIHVMSANELNAAVDGARIRLEGELKGEEHLPRPTRDQLDIFYHLRKQREWKELRAVQTRSDWSRIPSFRADLGREANIRFSFDNKSQVPVTVLWNGAESVHELERYDACITEWFVVQPGESFVTLPQGMRYVQLYLFGPIGAGLSADIRFEDASVRPPKSGSFASDSPLMNEIYDVSVHTNRVCHQIGLWDGIKRDRLNWTYDFYLAAKADYVLWDDLSVLKRSIRELGGTPYGYWMNSIPAYTLWWLCNIWEYYWFTKDAAFVEEIAGDLRKHVAWVNENRDPEHGYLRDPGHLFIEWVPMEQDEARLCMQALLKMARDNLVRLNEAVPGLNLDADWQLSELPESGFVSGKSAITPLLGIISGFVSEESAVRHLSTCRLKDPVTPLSAYWFAECCSLHGLHERAWEVIAQVWGTMLEKGASTFWEAVRLEPAGGRDFHDELTTYTAYDSYRMSLCHSWSSTPVQWISRFILGVEPVAPGYQKIRFSPQAVEGLTRVTGDVNTPFGVIHVEWSKQGDKIVPSIQLPDGIEIVS